MSGDQLLTPDQVSDRLQVPVATLSKWRYMREGPRYVRCGRHVRYPPERPMPHGVAVAYDGIA